MTMAYIVFVNPAILGTEGTGLSAPGVFLFLGGGMGASSVSGYIESGSGVAPHLGLRRLARDTEPGWRRRIALRLARDGTSPDRRQAHPVGELRRGHPRFPDHFLIKLSRGRAGEVHPLLYGAAVLFALAFVWPALHGLLS
jgi:hypothetical protein